MTRSYALRSSAAATQASVRVSLESCVTKRGSIGRDGSIRGTSRPQPERGNGRNDRRPGGRECQWPRCPRARRTTGARGAVTGGETTHLLDRNKRPAEPQRECRPSSIVHVAAAVS